MRYRVGIYGGCFNPMHLAHVDCILKAANMCEELYIVLSVSTVCEEIDYRLRYRWLYQLTSHIGNVKILILEDHCLTKQDYTPQSAMADCERIRSIIGKPVDAVFCGSDYGKDSFWGQCYAESEFISFPRNEMNSTAIRKNPYAHWNWLPTFVRPYYVKKVLLIGGESAGKSTLTINLAHHFNTNYVEEAGRAISLRSGTDELMLEQDYTEILLAQKQNEIEAVRHSNKVLFIDTDALITQFYLHFLEGEDASCNVKLSDAIDALNSYDLILFLEPDVEFVQDGGRSEAIRVDRVKYSEQIKEIFRKHGKEFRCITGDYQQRYQQAVQYVDALLNL